MLSDIVMVNICCDTIVSQGLGTTCIRLGMMGEHGIYRRESIKDIISTTV